MHYTTSCCIVPKYHSCLPRYYATVCGTPTPIIYQFWTPYGLYDGRENTTSPMVLPQEVSVDSTANVKNVVIGGNAPTSLTLEYTPDAGASTPMIKVTIEHDASTSTWQETASTDGYHVKSQFLSVEPGNKVTLEVTEAMGPVTLV